MATTKKTKKTSLVTRQKKDPVRARPVKLEDIEFVNTPTKKKK